MKFQASLIFLICIFLSIFNSLSAQDCGCDFTLQANGKVLNNGIEITLKTPWYINANDIKIKPGQVFCFKNIQYSKGITILNFAGTESQPIIIKNCGGQTVIDTREHGIIFSNSKYFKFLGNGDPSVKYGFKVTARNKDRFFLDAKEFTTNFEIAYVEVAGASTNPASDTAGFAGIGAKTNPLCDGSVERGVWTMYNPIIHDNYIHNTGGEGIYMGYGWYKEKSMVCPCENDPSTSCTILVHSHSIVGARVYNNITENTGYDGIQVKNADQDCEIYNNIIRNYGLRNEESQNEGLLLGEGTTGKAYNNWIENGTGNGIQNHAMGNQDIFNNVIINPQEYGFVCWDGPAVVRVGYYNFFNNTIINAGLDGFNFFGPGGGPKRVYNNIIAKVGDGRALLKKANDVILFEESNNYLTNTIADVKFISATAPYNIHLQSTSPAIDKGKDLTSFGITKDFDLAPRPSGPAFDIGAYEFRNLPPVVKITQPLNNAVFAPGSVISIKADASDPDGSVTKVEFYNGTIKLGEDLTSPYSFDWSDVKEGTYTIKVVATDNGGSTGSSTITIVVKNTLPAITITKPANNSSNAAGKAITIEANATDSDGSITKVEFYYTINNKDTILIGSSTSSPYQVSWTPLTTGTYKIIAKATDNNGGVSKTAISVTITNTLPTISIVAPANNSSFPFGTDVELKVNAADADGTVTKVEYFNGATKIGESTTAPFSFLWKNIPLGTYTITAKATDNIGGAATSLPIQFSVINTPPVVNITAPLNNARFSPGANITIETTATDEDGFISKVEFFYNTTNLIGSDNTAPYSINWNNVPEGSYTITVKATDNAGAVSSKTINITVVNNPPTVKITSPANLSVYETGADIEITAEALDSDGSISKVVFYNGTTLLGEDLTGPYSYTWKNVQNGTYSITAVAFDNLGKQTVSAAIKIIVNVTVNIPPDVTITNPADNQILTPGNIIFEVNATDPDGSVVLVELFNGSSKIGESKGLPYTFSWTNLTEGVYVITAKATDNNNETNSSAPITITIYNAPPIVTINTPANNQTFDSDDQILISTTITDTDGTIIKAEFFLNDSLLGTVTSAPYNLTLNNLPPGTYNITVKATDNLNKEDSETIQITIKNQLPSVSITAPSNGAAFKFSEPILLTVDANDPDGSIKNVEYYINGVLTTTRTYPDFSFTWTNAPIGEYEIIAFATDNDGAKVASAPVFISIGKRPVTVALVSPETNSTYESGESIDFSAKVTDPDNAVVKIEFYANDIKIGESLAPDYQYTWTNSVPGNFEVYAVVIEDNGKKDTSDKVVININKPNKLPVITITSPGSNSAYSYCSEILVTAISTDEDGVIAKVDFFVNDQLAGTDLSAPYTLSVSNLDPGSNTITATAYDNKGGESSTSMSVSIIDIPVAIFDIISGKDTINSGSGTIIQSTTLDSLYFLNTSDLNPLQVKAFEWVLSDGTTSEEKFLAHNFIQGGLYKAALILTDINGCKISNEVQIFVKDTALQAQEPYWIPNALSPYETNPENKVIKVYGKLAPEDFSFTIYSRWGQVLYSTNDLAEAKNIGWDGDDAPMGTYTYVLKAREVKGNKIEKSGTITLIR